MPKVAAELSAIEVNRLSAAGKHTVGGVAGLYLNISKTGARSWILRCSIAGKRHEMGLGSFPTISLKHAREAARDMVRQIISGDDPLKSRIEQRNQRREASARRITFDEAFETFFEKKLQKELSNSKHKAQWRSTLHTYASPMIGTKPVCDVNFDDILGVLMPIWTTKTETASRVRMRLEAVLDWARVNGLRDGENPARWKGNLDKTLPSPTRLKKEVSHPAIALPDAPIWFCKLLARGEIAAQALQFLTLTAARSGEVRGALWSEVDLDTNVWVIPATRMKAKREHRVPLSNAAVSLLSRAAKFPDCDFIFPSAKGAQLSDMTLSAVMRRMQQVEEQAGVTGYVDTRSGRPAVPHGLRSTFRDWVAEKTTYPSDMAELALAHNIGTKVQQAYLRADMLERRREMMEDWAEFLSGSDFAKGLRKE